MRKQKIEPVFPTQIVPSLGGQGEKQVFLGMSLRDYIAIEVMKILVIQNNCNQPYMVAIQSYKQADEMLAQREK